MKVFPVILFLLMTGHAYSQSKSDCIRIKLAAETAFVKGALRDALVKLRALKVCDPSQGNYVDNKIIEVYDSIRTQRDRAEDAQRRAEAASAAERKAKEEAKKEQRRAEAAAAAERKAKEEAQRQTEVAEARLKTMVSRKLASVGLGVQNGIDPEWHLSLLLGIEAMNLSYSSEADHVIRNAMDHLPELIPELIKEVPKAGPGGYDFSFKNGYTDVLEVKTGKVVFSVPGNTGWYAYFIGNGHKLILASEDHKAYIVQLPQGKVLDSLVHNQTHVELLALTDDERYLATLDYDVHENGAMRGRDEVFIWDVNSGKLIQRFSPDASLDRSYNIARFKRIEDQHILITGFQIWQIGAGKPNTPKRIPGLLTYDGKFMLVRPPDNQSFSLYSFPDTTFLFKGDTEVSNFTTSPNGKYLAVSNNSSLEIWDIRDRRKLYEKPALNEEETFRLSADYITFSDNGKYFAVGSSSSVYDTYTGKKAFKNFWSETTATVQVGSNGTVGMVPVHQLERKDPAFCNAFSPDGDTLYTYTNSGVYHTWRLIPGGAAAVAELPMQVTDIYSASDNYQYISDYKGLYKWDKHGRLDTIRHIRRSVYALAVNEKTGLLAMAGDSEFMVPEKTGVNTINLLNGDTAFIPLQATVSTMDIDPEGKLALAGTVGSMTNNEEMGLWIVDAANRTKRKVDSSQLTYYKACFWKSANKVLVAGGYDIFLKDLTKGTILFKELYSNTRALAVDKGFKHIALGTKERVSVYTMDENDKPSAPITRHFDGEVVTTDFSASGDYLLIGLKTKNYKGAVVIWNLKDNSIALQIVTSVPVIKAVFDRANADNIVVAEGLHVKVYDWKADALLKRAAKRVLRPLTKEEWDTYVGNEFPFHMKK